MQQTCQNEHIPCSRCCRWSAQILVIRKEHHFPAAVELFCWLLKDHRDLILPIALSWVGDALLGGYISPAVEEESSVSDWCGGTKDLPSYLKVGPLCDNIYAQSSSRLQMRPHPCLALFASLIPILLRSFLQQIMCIQIFKSDAASREPTLSPVGLKKCLVKYKGPWPVGTGVRC